MVINVWIVGLLLLVVKSLLMVFVYLVVMVCKENNFLVDKLNVVRLIWFKGLVEVIVIGEEFIVFWW